MPAPKREPEWVQPFLAALASCGNVTRAAGLAGVDVTGPYNRRNRYPDFKAAWERVLGEREARAGGPSTGLGTSGEGGEEAVSIGPAGDGVKVSRVAGSRWSKGTEDKFLEELTACANVRLAAAAVGFSAASAYRRRSRDARFAEGWEAAMAVGRTRLEAHLIDAANRALDPDSLPIADGAPKVTVSEAISILKHQPAGSRPGSGGRSQGRGGRRGDGYMDWVTDDDVDMMEQAEKARASIHDKLARMLEQDNQRRLAAGYTLHGEDWIPPGWVYTGGSTLTDASQSG